MVKRIKTFGYTGFDGPTTATIEDNIRLGKFTCPDNGIGLSITARLNKNTSDIYTIKFAIYNEDFSLLASTDSTLTNETGMFAITLPLPNPPVLQKNASYWLAAWSDAGPGTCQLMRKATGGVSEVQVIVYDGVYPDPLVPSSLDDFRYDIYCSYETDVRTGGWIPRDEKKLKEQQFKESMEKLKQVMAN